MPWRRGWIVAVIGVVAAAVVATFVAARSQGEPQWMMTDLGTLGGGYSIALAINDRGQVVGTSRTLAGTRHYFFWQHGRLTDLGPARPGLRILLNERGQVVVGAQLWVDGKATTLPFGPYALNDRGEIVGISRAFGFRPVVWQHGRVRTLPIPSGDDGVEDPFGINNRGVIAGNSYRNGVTHAIRWDPNGTVSRLPAPRALPNCTAVAINDDGWILASCTAVHDLSREHTVLWSGNRVRDLGTIGGERMSPVALNDRGDVLVVARSGAQMRAVVWADGTLRDIGRIDQGVGPYQVAGAINNRREVVSGRSNRAFIWKDGVITSLGQAGVHSGAYAINGHGDIVGYSEIGDASHAVLWTPTRADNRRATGG